jgi:Flp pilus assembly protein TadD
LREIALAESAVRGSLEMQSNNPEAWFLLGLIHSEKKQYHEAVRAYEQVVRYENKHPNAWMNLARAYLEVGNRTKARIAFDNHRKILAERDGAR